MVCDVKFEGKPQGLSSIDVCSVIRWRIGAKAAQPGWVL
jgi:hypothetical protein